MPSPEHPSSLSAAGHSCSLQPCLREVVDEVLQAFDVPTEALRCIADFMDSEMTKGLTTAGSSMYMFPTYVTRHCIGGATGHFLGLDLGGTNFRVVTCQLQAGCLVQEKVKVYTVPDDKMRGVPGSALFDYLAECVQQAVAGTSPDIHFTAALAFAFGVEMLSLDSGRLVTWSKGFDLPDTIGHDVLDLMRCALHRRGLSNMVTLVALLNDSVGAFISGMFDNPDTAAAIIVGTGTNMCYFEPIANIAKLPSSQNFPPGALMLMSSEWGALSDSGNQQVLPHTQYDKELDASSLFPGQQVYEKMIAGMGLGELVRLALLDLQVRQVFTQQCDTLRQRDSLGTPLVSQFMEDISADLTSVDALCKAELQWTTTASDRQVIQSVAAAVLCRAGRLIAAGIWCITRRLHCMGHCNIAFDGSVYEKIKTIQIAVEAALKELAGDSHGIRMSVVKDGSGRGAALLAALYNADHEPNASI